MRIKRTSSLLGVMLVLSVGLMSAYAAEQNLNQTNNQLQNTEQSVQINDEKAKYKPISDVRHVVPPYDNQDKENTKEIKDVELESAAPVKDAIALEGNDVVENSVQPSTEPALDSENPVSNTEPQAVEAKNTPVENSSADESNKVNVSSEQVSQPEEVIPAVKNEVQEEETKTPESGYEAIKNKLWCITFQLVWNTFMDKVTHGPVLLAGGNPPIANELNKKLYTSDLLNEDSYYTTYGKISKSLKRQIERAIEKKFDETSDILDTINWEAKNSYLFYAMLKKDFNFETPFDKLTSASFNGSIEKVKYFGVNQESDRKLRKNVHVLFYKSSDEYAVRLSTKEKEDVILYRTDKKDNFENLYLYVTQQDVSEKFSKEDSLMVPNFKIDKTISYDELCGKKIKGTNKVITQALQTIKFNMDNKGGTLKSEAAMAIMRMSLAPQIGRKYNFDKEFVLFLKEEGKDKPYFAVRVDNPEFLVKE